MIWWEFTQDNGDGSYSKRRYRTEYEARTARDWFEKEVSWWQGDGDGISMVDTDSSYFFNSFEQDKLEYS